MVSKRLPDTCRILTYIHCHSYSLSKITNMIINVMKILEKPMEAKVQVTKTKGEEVVVVHHTKGAMIFI